jgi:maltooligosyltrehalose trehalohydrolase
MSVGRIHHMPFGAEIVDESSVRFRLWAPAEQAVSLALGEPARLLPMTATEDGWFELTTVAHAGDRYSFALADGLRVPDPASRRQLNDVHDASVVIDPLAYRWSHAAWHGRPWHEAVIYELHVGTFTREGNFDGVRKRLPDLALLGITAIELMPIADFSGRWNWGYDGVLPYAPDVRYGTPDDLKMLIDAAHGLGIMVLLDVVYNHFGPDGNYIHRYAPQTFTDRRHTPWGKAIDYTRQPVREFFIDNAVYWTKEYCFDGLRLDAVHEIVDERKPDLLIEIATRVRGAALDRQVHLVVENDNNAATLLQPKRYDAQWNDDFHHAAHVVLTGETSGYYADYRDEPVRWLARCLAKGFGYQGERSPYRERGRGESSAGLAPTAFVNFLQNHDQVGNRAFGERIITLAPPEALRALYAILLLAPSIPMIFMGEESGAGEPFQFFVDFGGDLGDAVRNGRRQEFSKFADFADPVAREKIPDPVSPETYRRSALDWKKRETSESRGWRQFFSDLLTLRRLEIVPRLAAAAPVPAQCTVDGTAMTIRWTLGGGVRLVLQANLSPLPLVVGLIVRGRRLWSTTGEDAAGSLPPWFSGWWLEEKGSV